MGEWNSSEVVGDGLKYGGMIYSITSESVLGVLCVKMTGRSSFYNWNCWLLICCQHLFGDDGVRKGLFRWRGVGGDANSKRNERIRERGE